jgi:hypothetical protein
MREGYYRDDHEEIDDELRPFLFLEQIDQQYESADGEKTEQRQVLQKGLQPVVADAPAQPAILMLKGVE